ncbi:WD repeat-containing protein 63 [Heterocephalus glaber]|uniref:Dynein axonemal intermediate chain 3 n=1 Tax=Heterocephalus glaber TaxID=10181 RepID=G5C920_HETGA|nr:WD repeat-containing protein 63 [Heterocephalus glaber]
MPPAPPCAAYLRPAGTTKGPRLDAAGLRAAPAARLRSAQRPRRTRSPRPRDPPDRRSDSYHALPGAASSRLSRGSGDPQPQPQLQPKPSGRSKQPARVSVSAAQLLSDERPASGLRLQRSLSTRRARPPANEEEEPVNMESMGHPEIYPLVLTTKTQEIFNCRIDEDITDEIPYKLIKKEDIFEDLHRRAAVSDFHPIKKIVQDYPGNELLLVYDKDFKYGLNFYIIGTEEGKDNYLNAPEVPEEQEEHKELIPEETYTYTPPISKPWVSLGSEKEIEEESVKKSTKQVTYMISRKRIDFGAPISFSDQNASSVKEAYIECTAYPDKNFTLKKLEKNVGMQAIPQVKDTSTQTKCVEIALQQNEIMNLFTDDWKSLAEEEGTFGDKTDTHLKEFQSFTDLHSQTEKTITCVSWHPAIYGLIAVSVAVRLSLEDRVHFSGKLLLQPSLILFWSFSDPIHPQLMLESPDDIFCFKFCPSDPNIIAGGCINGQIVLWDITAHADRIENIKADGSGSKKATLKPIFLLEPDSNKEAMYIRHCAVSSIENGHKNVITDIHWLADTFEMKLSKGETNLDHCPTKISLSEDQLLSKLSDKMLTQTKAVEMNPYRNLEAGLANLLKPIDDFCTKFFVGTEEGEVIYTDWKMERDPDTGRMMAKKPVCLYSVHDGAVHTVQRSPFYSDIILTVGGWNVAIWKEGVMTGPLLRSCCAAKRYTSGHWSLTRPGVFYIGREDGYVDTWDLLEKTHEPAQSQNICITMITYIKPWTFSAKQQFLAIADYYGTLHILEIPWTLSHPSTNEVSSVNYYFEREVKHLEYVEQRKNIREQEKKDMELEMEKKKHKTYQKSKEQIEAELKMDYESYLELEKTILINLGLVKVPETMSHMETI